MSILPIRAMRLLPALGFGVMLLAPPLAAQECPDPVPEESWSVIMPLAPRALLLDAVRTDGNVVAVGDRGIVLTSVDGGESWTQRRVPTRIMLTGVYFANRELGWAVGHDSIILKTTDGGENWRCVYHAPELEMPLFDVWFKDEQYGLAIGAYGIFLKTTDGGETWETFEFDPQELPMAYEFEVEPEPEDTAAYDEAFREEDFEVAMDFHLNKLASAGGGILYIAAEAGNVFHSHDSGRTWLHLPSEYSGSYFSILPLGRNDLLVFGLRGNIFRSHDGGIAWEAVPSPVEVTLNEGTVMSDGTIVIVGMSGTLLVSQDGGQSFRLIQREDRKAITRALKGPEGSLLLFGEMGAVKLPREAYLRP